MFETSGQKIAVLESKLNIYEELSREMLSKLESAVEKISEGNTNIAMILTKHDERIDQSIKTDKILVKMIDEIKEYSDKECENIFKKIEKLEQKIEELVKFRWQVGGVAAVAVIAVTVINAFVPKLLGSNQGSNQLTPYQYPSSIERAR